MTAGMPPARWKSGTVAGPDGLTRAICGVVLHRSAKSSIVMAWPASRAIAMRWSTVLVEPPIAAIARTALPMAAAVIIERAPAPARTSRTIRSPVASPACSRAASVAGIVALPGRLMPIASAAQHMELAVPR